MGDFNQPKKQRPNPAAHSSSAGSKSKKRKQPAMTRKNTSKRMKPAAIVGIVLLIVCLTIGFGSCFSHRFDAGLQEGIAYLESQENLQTTDLVQDLSKKQRDRLLKAVNSGEFSIFSLYRNALIFGDSRVYGFSSYGFVPSQQVLAQAGSTINNISDYLDVVKEVQPEKIYFSYGVNDIGLQIGKDQGEDGYAKVYEEQIDKILEVSPHSQIIVNSIIPVTPETLKATPRWGGTEEYNRQIQEMCKRRGWTFVNNDELVKGGTADVYNEDGIHFKPEFYPIWAQNMIFSDNEN